MGNFEITIKAVGGHGCDRDAQPGDQLKRCGNAACPDCRALAFVDELKRFASVTEATLVHWPDGPGTVTDDLHAGQRLSGAFRPPPARVGDAVTYVAVSSTGDMLERPAVIKHVWGPQCVNLDVAYEPGDSDPIYGASAGVVERTSAMLRSEADRSHGYGWRR